MKKIIIAFALLVTTMVFAAAGDKPIHVNPNQDGDSYIQVNKGGVATKSFNVEGATSNIRLGPTAGSITEVRTVNATTGFAIVNPNGGIGTKLMITNTENTGITFDVNDGGADLGTAGVTARNFIFRQGTTVGEVGSIAAGAWTLGPASSTATQTVNGRKINVNTSPGSVSLGAAVSPNGTVPVSYSNVGSSFVSVAHNSFLEFDSGSAKFVQVTDGGGGRAGLFFCDFAAAGCIEIADPSTFFSSALTCGVGIVVAKVGASDHTIRVRNCSGITLNISVAVLGSEVSTVGNINTVL